MPAISFESHCTDHQEQRQRRQLGNQEGQLLACWRECMQEADLQKCLRDGHEDVEVHGQHEGNDVQAPPGTLQVAYFILAVRAQGLAAGPMGGFDAAGVDAEFFPDGRFHSILVVNIGHPGQNPWYGRLPRLNHGDVVQWA